MKHAELKKYLEQTWKLLEQNEQKSGNVLKSNDPNKVKALLDDRLPASSQTFSELLNDFQHQVYPSLNHNTSAQFGAYITGSGNKIGALAEFIKAFYNQNGLKWNNSPIASELEQLVIQWIAEFCQLSLHTKGFLTSGGSMSNLMCMHLALASRYPDREMKGLMNAPRFTIYCSNQTHSSVERAMVFLGLGREQLRSITVNEEFQISLSELAKTIEYDMENGATPLMIIGNAGTTNTGSIDDLHGLAKIAKQFNVWYHVDGAYGLPARRLDYLTKAFHGVDQADSVIINPHKWMYVPFEASCVLVKEIPQAIHLTPDYLFTENPGARWESSNHTIELSKEFRALKIWFTMKYFGAKRLTEFVDQDIQMTKYLGEKLALLPNIVVEKVHPLSILCFRYDRPDLAEEENERINVKAIRQIEKEGKIFITGTRLYGNTYLRIYFGNPERTNDDVDTMVQVIKETFTNIIS